MRKNNNRGAVSLSLVRGEQDCASVLMNGGKGYSHSIVAGGFDEMS